MFMFCECFHFSVLTALCHIYMNKWICYIVINDNSQGRMSNTQKMTITKLATRTAYDHNSQLKMEHFANTNDSSILSDIFARCGRTISPLLEKTASAGAEVAGTARILSNKYSRGTNSIWLQNVCKLCVTVK